MRTYKFGERLPNLPLSPQEPDYECNDCGRLFDLPPVKMRDPDGHDDFCPECGSKDIHRT